MSASATRPACAVDAPAPRVDITVNGAPTTTAHDGTFCGPAARARDRRAERARRVGRCRRCVGQRRGRRPRSPSQPAAVRRGAPRTTSSPTRSSRRTSTATSSRRAIGSINPAVATWLDTPFDVLRQRERLVQRVLDRRPTSTSSARARIARTPAASPTSCSTSSGTRSTTTRSSWASARSTAISPRGSPTSTRRTSPRTPASAAASSTPTSRSATSIRRARDERTRRTSSVDPHVRPA